MKNEETGMPEKKTVQPQKRQLLNRLKRIEGSSRGIQKKIEYERYCDDILHQISAVQAAINKVSLALLEDSTQHCVKYAIQANNGDEAIRELMDVVKTMIK